jgi:hypothetical protein
MDLVINARQGAHRMTLDQVSREMSEGIRRLATRKDDR